MKAMDEKHLREKYGIDDDDWERTSGRAHRFVDWDLGTKPNTQHLNLSE